MSLVVLPYIYVPDPTRSRAVFNGKIYIGEPDTNPRIVENQKAAILVQENGDQIAAEYPIATNSGGVPTYNGSPVAIDVTGDYSIAIDDRNDQQVYYFARASEVDSAVILEATLNALALLLNYDYSAIGAQLVTSEAGTLLDNAEFLFNTTTGEIWIVPPGIPVGSEVVSVTDEQLVTTNGSFTMFSYGTPVPNKIKTSQFVVEGTTGNPLPENGMLETYAIGEEIAFGWVATTQCEQITKDANGNVVSNNNTGTMRYTINKAENDTPLAAQIFASVMRCTDVVSSTYVQDYAAAGNGISVSESATEIYIDIDFSSFSGGVVFGASEQRGRLEILGSERVIGDLQPELLKARSWQDVSGGRAAGVTYTNEDDYEISVIVSLNYSTTATLATTLSGLVFNGYRPPTAGATNRGVSSFKVQPGGTYSVSATGASVQDWIELRI